MEPYMLLKFCNVLLQLKQEKIKTHARARTHHNKHTHARPCAYGCLGYRENRYCNRGHNNKSIRLERHAGELRPLQRDS